MEDITIDELTAAFNKASHYKDECELQVEKWMNKKQKALQEYNRLSNMIFDRRFKHHGNPTPAFG